MVKSLGNNHLPLMNRCAAVILVSLLLWLSKCASPPKHKAYPVLEPMESPVPVGETTVNPRYSKLENLLFSLGYEPVGMQYETDANLDLLYTVFSSPVAERRKIKLVYTGLRMDYDKAAQSLTVGGSTNMTAILAYIQRNIPLNNEPVIPISRPFIGVTPSPTPSPSAPSPLPVPSSAPSLIPTEEIPIE